MRFLIFAFLLCTAALSTAQTVERGDFLVGVNSPLSGVELQELSLTPSVMYGITDRLFTGVSFNGTRDGVELGLGLRSYIGCVRDNQFFAQVEFDTNTEEDTNGFSIGTGFTAPVGNHWFVEPTFSFNFAEEDNFGLGIGFGLRL